MPKNVKHAVLGDGVSTLAVGDAVVGSNWGGIFAEAANMRASGLRAIPAELSFEQAAVQLGKHLGARVIASASSDDKRAPALAGGAVAIESRAADWCDQVKQACGGKGVDVVFDPVGGVATEPAFRSLGWNGRLLVVGLPGGIGSLRTNLALLMGANLIGVDLRQFGVNEPAAAEANMRGVFELAAEGVLRPAIARRYPLEQFAEAMDEAASGRAAGRIVLTMD